MGLFIFLVKIAIFHLLFIMLSEARISSRIHPFCTMVQNTEHYTKSAATFEKIGHYLILRSMVVEDLKKSYYFKSYS